jgi:hypothetical protein
VADLRDGKSRRGIPVIFQTGNKSRVCLKKAFLIPINSRIISGLVPLPGKW